MTLLQQLLEVLDSKVPYEVLRSTNAVFRARAELDSRPIVFSAVLDDDNVWTIEFYETKDGKVNSGLSGSGEELKVFSFVKAALEEFIDRYEPATIQFTSDRDSKSRSSVYERMFKRLPNYELVKKIKEETSDLFVYKRKSPDK